MEDVINGGSNESDLVKLIQAEDPEFDPEAVSDGRHPCRKVLDVCMYPETKAIQRAKKVEYQVLDTYANLLWLLDLFGAKVRYNRMNWTREVEIPGHFIYKDDAQNSALALIDYLATLNDFPTKKLDQHLAYASQMNAYHPVLDAIYSKEWDGIPRLDAFAATLKTEQPHAKDVVKTWMVAAVAAAHSVDGFANQGVLVLQGKQEIGKTTWVKNLDPTKDGSIKEGAFLDPSRQDSVIMMSSYWIVELGELETIFKRSDIGRLKAYVTTQFDHVRFSYARKPTKLPRRSAYIATVNSEHFLLDETGNRRWWTLALTDIDNNHGLDIQQVWAEVLALWQSGFSPYPTPELQRQINLANEDHERIDPLREMLNSNYDWSTDKRRQLTATEVLMELGYSKPERSAATRIGVLLQEFTGEMPRKNNGRRVHDIPYKFIRQ